MPIYKLTWSKEKINLVKKDGWYNKIRRLAKQSVELSAKLRYRYDVVARKARWARGAGRGACTLGIAIKASSSFTRKQLGHARRSTPRHANNCLKSF